MNQEEYPYELGISEVEGEWMWSVSFDDETKSVFGREQTFREALKKMLSPIGVSVNVA